MEKEIYNVVGYGSLISHSSFKEDYSDKKFKPVIVNGYKRIFNILEENKGLDVLNILESKKNKFNGVLFKLNEKELKKLKEREDWYNIEEAEYYDFETKKKIGKGLLFIDHLILIDKHKKKPDKKYFILCREAAYHLKKEFGKMWDETTYTSAGEKISEWIKNNASYDTLK
ncbi:hypothetical protein AUJ84_04585 [Candidatus Pacearchaeota archaeon CG1_02_32_132]|nr:MAG: hypothetical protein AUJ84_04585 [Candidatus Pacearchaeota archaeon CG1_02_32_132]